METTNSPAATHSHFVQVTTGNARIRTYRFNSEIDAKLWIQLLANIDPKTARTATINKV